MYRLNRQLYWGAILAPLVLGFSTGNGLAQTGYTYDARGRLVEIVYDDGKLVEYDYDDAGNRTSESISDAWPYFSVADDASTEGSNIDFVVSRTGNTTIATSVDYATSTGTAGSSDFTANSGTLSFAVDETSKTVSVVTASDSIYENNEAFTLTLSNPAGNASIIDGDATGTINDNDSGPAFSINNVSVTEGGTLSFTVSKSGATAFSHNINYATANGTANGSDYTSKSGTLTFTSGQTSKSVSVSTTQDSNYEANETLYVNLSSATSGATISDSQGVGTINNDDVQIVYVRNSAGVLQSGYTETIQSHWRLGDLYKTKSGSTVIHLGSGLAAKSSS